MDWMQKILYILLLLTVLFIILTQVIPSISALTMECEIVGSTVYCQFPQQVVNSLQVIWNKAKEIYKKVRFEIKLFGTEYVAGEEGKIFLQLLEDNEPVENGVCQAKIYYPNNTPYYSAGLNYLGEKGLYYLDLAAPDELGVYMIAIDCWKPYVETSFYSYFNTLLVDLYRENTLTNSSLLGETQEAKIGLSSAEKCVGDWEDRLIDFPSYQFVYNISELYGWFAVDEDSYNVSIHFYFYRWNNLLNQKFSISETELNATLNTSFQKLYFPSAELNQAFSEDEKLLATLCAYSPDEIPKPAPSLLFDFGSESYNSSFKRAVKGINISLATQIRGGGEMHVSKLFPKMRNFITAYFSTEVTNTSCIDNSTLREFKIITYNITEKGKSDVFTVKKYQDFHCDWGCDWDRNVCSEPPFIKYLWIVGGFVFVLFFTIIIISRWGRI